ncbi:MAG: FAD-dependent monooxygenase [Hyphomicrobiales bacterium]
METGTDIAVIGAALNGLAAALALGGPHARRPVEVVIIDRSDPRRFADVAFDGRASAITASSKRMLEALGAWDAIAPHAQPMNEIVVTDARGEARPALLHFEEQAAPSAYMVENRHLYATLLDKVLAAANIELRTGTAVTSFAFAPGLARIDAGGTGIRASLVIAADGRDSPARQAAGIKVQGWPYDQMGIVATVAHELPHHGRAEEHFRESGPFAILPLTGNRSSLVWTERTAEARRIMALDDEGFAHELRSRFGTHLGRVTPVGPRHAYPLGLFLAHSFVGKRLALIGDAAHVIHPIAGLGLNLGFRDAAALAECIAEAVALGLDPGGADVLSRYERRRRFDTVATAVATDGLNRLFSNEDAGLRALRDLGLMAVDRIAPLKTLFTREAAGETGQLPKLMRGEPV